jgi:A/G-specific adenine glycosylase
MSAKIQKFQQEIISYYLKNKRTMPWRDISNPYKIFVSEMMLQQTQVERVKIKYAEFIKKFPTLKSVAQADKSEILKVWQGLGYNRRALFIKRACEEIISKHKGIFPKDFQILQTLPGIGPSTAGAICAFAYNQPVFFIETNVRAVILHFFFEHKEKISDKEVMQTLQKVTSYHPKPQTCHPELVSGSRNTIARSRVKPGMTASMLGITTTPRDWYYALYDYGTFLKKSLGKNKTKLHQKSKHYSKQSKFEGSFRQKRAQVLKLKLSNPDILDTEILNKLTLSPQELEDVFISLDKDGLI